MLRAGELRRRLDILANTPTTDVLGGTVKTWVAVLADVPAKLIAERGMEKFVGAAEREYVPVRFLMRTPTVAVTNGMRLRDEAGVLYDVEASVPSNNGRELVVMCVRKGQATP